MAVLLLGQNPEGAAFRSTAGKRPPTRWTSDHEAKLGPPRRLAGRRHTYPLLSIVLLLTTRNLRHLPLPPVFVLPPKGAGRRIQISKRQGWTGLFFPHSEAVEDAANRMRKLLGNSSFDSIEAFGSRDRKGDPDPLVVVHIRHGYSVVDRLWHLSGG